MYLGAFAFTVYDPSISILSWIPMKASLVWTTVLCNNQIHKSWERNWLGHCQTVRAIALCWTVPKGNTHRTPTLICAMVSETITGLKHIIRYFHYSYFEPDISKKQKQTKIAVLQCRFVTRILKITCRCVQSILIRTCPSVNKLGTFNLAGIQVLFHWEVLSTIKFWLFSCEITCT